MSQNDLNNFSKVRKTIDTVPQVSNAYTPSIATALWNTYRHFTNTLERKSVVYAYFFCALLLCVMQEELVYCYLYVRGSVLI